MGIFQDGLHPRIGMINIDLLIQCAISYLKHCLNGRYFKFLFVQGVLSPYTRLRGGGPESITFM